VSWITGVCDAHHKDTENYGGTLNVSKALYMPKDERHMFFIFRFCR